MDIIKPVLPVLWISARLQKIVSSNTLIIKKINKKKLEALSPVFQNREKYDFFTLIRKLFMARLKFAADNHDIALMGTGCLRTRAIQYIMKSWG